MAEVTFKKPLITTVLKMDEELRIVKGAVYVPDLVDTQGDFMTKDEIRKMAYKFMEALRNQNVDTQHNFQKADAYVCESYIVEKADDDWPVGSWVVAMKINSDELWDDIKNGEYTGFSMAGTGFRIPNVDPPSA